MQAVCHVLCPVFTVYSMWLLALRTVQDGTGCTGEVLVCAVRVTRETRRIVVFINVVHLFLPIYWMSRVWSNEHSVLTEPFPGVM